MSSMSTTRIEERRRWIEREIRKANQRIVHNAKELREVMDRVLELSQEHANLLLVSALWQSYGDLVTGTPVDTGRAQMGWHVSGEVDDWKPPEGEYKRQIDARIREALEKISTTLQESDVVYIMNNLEYITALEAGWSRQSSGFVALFLQQVRYRLEKLVEAANRME